MRGLKFRRVDVAYWTIWSHPAGMRGLKLRIPRVPQLKVIEVASRRDAWIEIFRYLAIRAVPMSHPAGMRGLKFGVPEDRFHNFKRRIPQGCVD